MLSGNIRKDRIIAVTNVLIAYSTTDLWLYAHTFLYEYITSKGARVKMGIVVGIPWFLLEEMQFGLSIAIAVLKSRKTKLLLIAAYFLLSSWWFIPDRPYRWLYWSVGSALYFYALDNFIALLKIRHSLKESLLNYGLVLAIYVFYAVFVDFILLGNDPTELGMVLARYFGFRTLLIIGCSVLYYWYRDKKKKTRT